MSVGAQSIPGPLPIPRAPHTMIRRQTVCRHSLVEYHTPNLELREVDVKPTTNGVLVDLAPCQRQRVLGSLALLSIIPRTQNLTLIYPITNCKGRGVDLLHRLATPATAITQERMDLCNTRITHGRTSTRVGHRTPATLPGDELPPRCLSCQTWSLWTLRIPRGVYHALKTSQPGTIKYAIHSM